MDLGAVVPHLARGNPLGAIPHGIPGQLETAAGTMPTAVDSGVRGMATAIQSKVTAVAQSAGKLENISLGTRKICLNGASDCKTLPFDIASALPSGASDLLGGALGEVQSLESTIFGTLRNSLIAGVTLVVCFGIGYGFTSRLPKPLSTSWRRAAVTLVGFVCLVIPFLVSTVTVGLLQSRIKDSLSDNAVLSTKRGNAWKYCAGAFVSAFCMFGGCIYATFIS